MAQAAALLDDSLSGALVEEDPELISAVRQGDDRAFERLYRRYHRRISAYVRGMVSDHARAEDVTQEMFLSALRRLRASDQTIVFKPWLYEIARNACIDQYRRAQRTPEVSYEGEPRRPSIWWPAGPPRRRPSRPRSSSTTCVTPCAA